MDELAATLRETFDDDELAQEHDSVVDYIADLDPDDMKALVEALERAEETGDIAYFRDRLVETDTHGEDVEITIPAEAAPDLTAALAIGGFILQHDFEDDPATLDHVGDLMDSIQLGFMRANPEVYIAGSAGLARSESAVEPWHIGRHMVDEIPPEIASAFLENPAPGTPGETGDLADREDVTALDLDDVDVPDDVAAELDRLADEHGSVMTLTPTELPDRTRQWLADEGMIPPWLAPDAEDDPAEDRTFH